MIHYWLCFCFLNSPSQPMDIAPAQIATPVDNRSAELRNALAKIPSLDEEQLRDEWFQRGKLIASIASWKERDDLRWELAQAIYDKHGWSYETVRHLIKHTVYKGMPPLQAAMSLGNPKRTNRTIKPDGATEVWTYERDESGHFNTELIFRDDQLRDWTIHE